MEKFDNVKRQGLSRMDEEENDDDDDDMENPEKLSLDLLDDDDDDDNCEEPEQHVYQIRPQLYNKFKPFKAREVIRKVLFNYLNAKTYNAKDAVQWTKNIADTIKGKIKEFKCKRYKYIVNVVLGEQHGAGIRIGTRCVWDTEADAYAYNTFLNDTIFCVATVYAIYFY